MTKQLQLMTMLCLLALCHASPAIADQEPGESQKRSGLRAAGSDTNLSAQVKEQRVEPAASSAKLAVASMIHLMLETRCAGKGMRLVKVPTSRYFEILSELQIRNARFLAPGAAVPEEARLVFRLRAQDSGLCQTVYFQ